MKATPPNMLRPGREGIQVGQPFCRTDSGVCIAYGLINRCFVRLA